MNNTPQQVQPKPLGPQPSQNYQTFNQIAKQPQKPRYLLAAVIVTLLAIIAVVLLLLHKSSTKPTDMPKGCAAQVFSEGSSGHCVSDAQTLIDEIESGGYTECPFQNTVILPINGSFNGPTKTQIESVQKWFNCYTSQEGQQGRIAISGQVDRSTWDELCSYGYLDPMRSDNHTSSFYPQALIAGRDADCSSI